MNVRTFSLLFGSWTVRDDDVQRGFTKKINLKLLKQKTTNARV